MMRYCESPWQFHSCTSARVLSSSSTLGRALCTHTTPKAPMPANPVHAELNAAFPSLHATLSKQLGARRSQHTMWPRLPFTPAHVMFVAARGAASADLYCFWTIVALHMHARRIHEMHQLII